MMDSFLVCAVAMAGLAVAIFIIAMIMLEKKGGAR